MDRSITRFVVLLGSLAAVLAGIASAAGVSLRGDLETTEFVTARGEALQLVTEGIYRFNSEGIVAEGIGWDIVTLFLVVPATLVTLLFVRRGSMRATLAAAGLLVYVCYQSAQYAVFWALGPLYPLYVATLALSVSALGLLLYGLDMSQLRVRAGRGFPRRSVLGYSTAVVIILAGLWLPVIVSTWGATTVTQLEGAATLVVPAFDLGLLVPLAVFTALAVRHSLPVGYVLGSVLLVKGGAMALAIAAMLAVEWTVTDELALPPLVVFLVVAGVSVIVGARALRSIEDVPSRSASEPVTSLVPALAPGDHAVRG